MKKAMRLLLALALALALVFAFVACGNTPEGPEDPDETNPAGQTAALSDLLAATVDALSGSDSLALDMKYAVDGSMGEGSQPQSVSQSGRQYFAVEAKAAGMNIAVIRESTAGPGAAAQSTYAEAYMIDGFSYNRYTEDGAFIVSSGSSVEIPELPLEDVAAMLKENLAKLDGTATANQDGLYTYTATIDIKGLLESVANFLEEGKTLSVGSFLAPILLNKEDATAADLAAWVGETFAADITFKDFVPRVDQLLGLFELSVEDAVSVAAAVAGIDAAALQEVFAGMGIQAAAPAAGDTVYAYAMKVLADVKVAVIADPLLASMSSSTPPADESGDPVETQSDTTEPAQTMTFAQLGQMLQQQIASNELTVTGLFDQIVPSMTDGVISSDFIINNIEMSEGTVELTLQADSSKRIVSGTAKGALAAVLTPPAAYADESAVSIDYDAEASFSLAYETTVALPAGAEVDGIAFAEITLAAGGSNEIPYVGDVASLVENNQSSFKVYEVCITAYTGNAFAGSAHSSSYPWEGNDFTVEWKDGKVVLSVAADKVIEVAQAEFDKWVEMNDPAADANTTWTVEFRVRFEYKDAADTISASHIYIEVPVTLSAQA